MSIAICGECDDAPATTGAWFNGKTWVDLCDGCFAWWENHALIEPRDVGDVTGSPRSDAAAAVPIMGRFPRRPPEIENVGGGE